MKKYTWILFDADDTLFHFDAFRGLQHLFTQYDVQFTEQDYVEYQTLNKALWIEYQNGTITAQQLQERRFRKWGEKLNVSPHALNSEFLTAMATICTPLPGAMSLLTALKGKSKLGIITNGFTEIQQARLKHNGYDEHFEILVISEEVGVAKPHIDIFDHALNLMGHPARDHVLMVGDNPHSDILGGINAGFDTCWLNVDKKSCPNDITPHFEVQSLRELEELLLPPA